MRVSRHPQGLAALAVLAIGLYFWYFTQVSLRTGFSQDDLMNLYFAWREPWTDIIKANFFVPTGVFRPFGTLFYRGVLDQFGYDPLPFRVICYIILWLNIPVAYWFVTRATASGEMGLLAALLHCVHANYFPLYYGSGSCYDVFAFLFFYLAFAFAIGPGPAGWKRTLGVTVLYALALNSKEIAAPFPALLLAFQLLHGRPRRDLMVVVSTGCVGFVFLWAKFTGSNSLMKQADYAPVMTLHRYLESTALYLNELCARYVWDTNGSAYLLLGLLIMAAMLRSRALLFAWVIVVVGSAPVAFITPRGLTSYYVPLLGYAMYAGVVLARSREWLTRRAKPAAILASQAAMFMVVYAALWQWNKATERDLPQYWQEWRHIRVAVRDFRSHPEWFPEKGSLLLLDDPFGEWEWATSFIAAVVGDRRDLQIHKYAKLDPKPSRDQVAAYTNVVTYNGSKYVDADRNSLP